MTNAPTVSDTGLLLIDVQERLVAAMPQRVWAQTLRNLEHLLFLAGKLELPVVYTEQYPQGLGKTIGPVQAYLEGGQAIEKKRFSCWEVAGFQDRLRLAGRRNWIVCGMESHICVFQTVRDLSRQVQVFLPVDAVISRKKLCWQMSLEQMRNFGTVLTTTECLLFDLLQEAGSDLFRSMSARLKEKTEPFGLS